MDLLIESLCMKLKIAAENKLDKMYPVFEPNQRAYYDNRTEDEWEELNRSIWVRLKKYI